MLKTYLYLPEELNKKVEKEARDQKKSKAEVLRMAIEAGLSPKVNANKIWEMVKKSRAIKGKGGNLSQFIIKDRGSH